jgi:ribosomal-protein-alanine N-acetyltransferase
MEKEAPLTEFKCPYCEDMVAFEEDAIGHMQECPHCGETLVVPVAGAEVGLKLPMPIRTSRLLIRRFEFGDVEALVALGAENVEGAMVNVQWDEPATQRWLQSESQSSLTHGENEVYLAVTLSDTGILIGHATISCSRSYYLQTNLDVFIRPEQRKNGFGLEVLKALLSFCFKGIGMHRVTISCDCDNDAARKLFASAGLRLEAEMIEDTRTSDGWSSTAWYAMLESEFGGTTKPPPSRD